MALQVKYGLFPRITGKGGYAKRLADLLLRMRLESAISEGSTLSAVQTLMPSDAIDNLIIIDREADPLTPLLTQLTYEGLLDEMYGIQNSQLEVDATILGTTSDPKDGDESIPQTSRGRKRKLALDSTDPLYASLRSENFSAVGPLLHRTAVRLDADFASRHAAKSTADLKAFVQRLPRLQAEQQATKLHTALAEDLIRRTDADLFTRALELEQNAVAGAGAADPAAQADTLHDLICRELPLPQTLRLLCICSLAANGLRARELDSLRRAVLHAYGFRHLLTLDALARMGLLTARAVSSASSYLNPLAAAPVVSTTPSQTSYTTLRAPLKLVDDDNIAAVATGSASPGAAAAASGAQKDISYAYSGYAPLSVRLLQCALQKPTVLALSDSKVSNAGGGGGSPSPGAGGVASANPPSQGWRPFEDLLKSVRGATFSEIQRTDDPATKARATLIGAQAMTPRGGSSGDTGASGTGGTGAGGSSTTAEKTSIVLFLGGLTRAELAAVRLVGERLKGRRRIVVATTQMLSGSEVVGCAMRRAGSSG